ncbi:hypothetical protein LIER_37978 [Lithospermum erythrorhizon]|uniref:Uncharacterized protein n=1 Tax=Lithospermum erythrorhizon TaxID=34254 RepID=A0AAV3PSX7_LITER
MEEMINYPTQNYSSHGNQMHGEPVGMNKKRKFPAEQLGLPLPKHKSIPSSHYESDSIINVNNKECNSSLIEVESIAQSSNDTSQSGSTKDSNSSSGGNQITTSISGQLRNDIWYSKASVSDQPSTSSVTWPSTCSTRSLYSLEGRAMTKSCSSSDETESSYNIREGRDLDHNKFGSHSSHYGEADIEFISHAEYICSDFSHDNMEQCIKDEDQDVIYFNRVVPDNYGLSSGRWPVNQDNEQGPQKMTIDKEFEQYFSELML